jgi:P-type conjugative transfer protein TrbJ
MRRFLLLTVSLAALAPADSAPAQQSVFCTNCSTVAQQLAGYARQLLQLEQEVTMAKNSIANTLALPSTIYHDMTSEVTQIGSIANKANMLNGNSRAMLDRLAITTGYPSGSLAQWQNQLIVQDNAISQAMRAAAEILQQQQTSLKSNASTLSDLQSQALGTGGQQATLQTLAGIQATVGQQIQSQQATLSGALQAMLTHQTAQADREAYMRRLTTAQAKAGIQASCGAAAATGYPAVAACKNATTGTASTQ